MLDGVSVIAVFWATWTPLTYIRPVPPESVIAMCVHWPIGSADGALMICSPGVPLPLTVIAKRGVEPALAARNIYVLVPEPKSKMRDQVVVAPGLTQVEIVKSCRLETMPVGSLTACASVVSSSSALPNLPGSRPTVGAFGSTGFGAGATLTGNSAYLAAATLACTSWSVASDG